FSRDWSSDVCSSDLHARYLRNQKEASSGWTIALWRDASMSLHIPNEDSPKTSGSDRYNGHYDTKFLNGDAPLHVGKAAMVYVNLHVPPCRILRRYILAQ